MPDNRASEEPLITPAPYKVPAIERPKQDLERLTREVEALQVAANNTTSISEQIALLWKATRLAVRLAPLTFSTLIKVRVMNNDKKTTLVGWLKGLLAGAAAIFLPDLANAGDAVTLVGQLIIAGWGLFEIVQGWLTNRSDN